MIESHVDLLYQALDTDYGVVVATSNAEFLRQRLYRAKKEDPDLDCISFIISPINGADLWIVKKGTPDG